MTQSIANPDPAPIHGRIAAIQWNNRLMSNLLMLWFVLAVFVFSILFILPIPVIVAVADPAHAKDFLYSDDVIRRVLLITAKIFGGLSFAALCFVYRDFNRAEQSFEARRLELSHPDPFDMTLENLCISRGLQVPELFLLGGQAGNLVTAVVLQGLKKRSKVFLTQADLYLPRELQDALAAQIVQRLHTRDTLFLTLLTFIGYFPYHMVQGANIVGKVLMGPALKATEFLLKPVRSWIIDLRHSRLDVGALELTKEKGPAQELLELLAPYETLQRLYHDPYLPLFIMQTDERGRILKSA